MAAVRVRRSPTRIRITQPQIRNSARTTGAIIHGVRQTAHFFTSSQFINPILKKFTHFSN